MLHLLVLPRREVSVEGYVVAEVALHQLIDLFLARGKAVRHFLDSLAQLAHGLALGLLAYAWPKLAVHGEHAVTFIR